MRRASPNANCISAIARRGFCRDGVLGKKGTIVRGHEFHYASLTAAGDDERSPNMRDGEGKPLGNAGGRRGQRQRHILSRHRRDAE